MIERAIFVLTSPAAGQAFLRVLSDLQHRGLKDATILHFVEAARGPAEPMADLANWVHHFEATVSNVDLALKRGDPGRWTQELARVRDIHLVVLFCGEDGVAWDLERITSPLRSLGVPILCLPAEPPKGGLFKKVLVPVRDPADVKGIVDRLRSLLGDAAFEAIHVAEPDAQPSKAERSGVRLSVVPGDDVAETALAVAEEMDATLIALSGESDPDPSAPHAGVPIVRPVIDRSDRPVLVSPAQPTTT